MRVQNQHHYSWRDDPNIPSFEDDKTLLVMDGECALCSAAARTIARLDRRDQVRICTSQSTLGHALLSHFGLRESDPETWLMLDNGRASGSFDAMMALFPRLHWGFLPIRLLKFLPVPIRDWLYVRIARNRYTVFGRTDLCAVPDEALRRRLVG